jgi:hypothetical protein
MDHKGRNELRWSQLFHGSPDMTSERKYTQEEKVEMYTIWRTIVHDYTGCNLTKSRDKLMAIAGVAMQMKHAFHDDYCAGLWKCDLVEQLAWRVIHFRAPVSDPWYRAPSWAWPAVDGVVDLPPRLQHDRDHKLAIQDNGLHLVLENPIEKCGTLFFGSLTAEVELLRLEFVANHLEASPWTWTTRHADCRFFPDVPFDENDFRHLENKDMASPATGKHPVTLHKLIPVTTGDAATYRIAFVAALLRYEGSQGTSSEDGLITGHALALRPGSGGQANIFTRIGLVTFRDLAQPDWVKLQALRIPKVKDKGQQIAASDNRSEWSHIITIL